MRGQAQADTVKRAEPGHSSPPRAHVGQTSENLESLPHFTRRSLSLAKASGLLLCVLNKVLSCKEVSTGLH